MAHHKSAKKRIRRNERVRVENKRYISTVRTAIKSFRLAVQGSEEGETKTEDLRPLFVKAQSLLAKASTKGILHQKNAARRIGRMAQLLKKAEAAPKVEVTAEAGTKKKVAKKAGTGKKKAAKKKTAKKTPSKKKK